MNLCDIISLHLHYNKNHNIIDKEHLKLMKTQYLLMYLYI